jgi:hypothetical protein
VVEKGEELEEDGDGKEERLQDRIREERMGGCSFVRTKRKGG